MINCTSSYVWANDWNDGNMIFFMDFSGDTAGKTAFAKDLVEMMDDMDIFLKEESPKWLVKALKAFDSYHQRKAST